MTPHAFVKMIAALKLDGECTECTRENCEDHDKFDLSNDDAVDTLQALIQQARDMLNPAH